MNKPEYQPTPNRPISVYLRKTGMLAAALIVFLSSTTLSARPFPQSLETLIDLRPNVILVIDTAAHMQAILPVNGYESDAIYPVHRFGSGSPVDDWLIDIDLLDASGCTSGFTAARRNGQTICLKLPSGHLYTRHYLDYLYTRFPNGTDLAATRQNGTTIIPAITVLESAVNAARHLIQHNSAMDFCLHTTSPERPGGSIELPCGADHITLIEAIEALEVDPAGDQSLPAAYQEVVQYLADSQISPVGWRCRSNAMVGFTDLARPVNRDSRLAQLAAATTDAFNRDLFGEQLLDRAGRHFGRHDPSGAFTTGDFPLQNLRSYLLTPAASEPLVREIAEGGGGAAFSFDNHALLSRLLTLDLSQHRIGTYRAGRLSGRVDSTDRVLLYDTMFRIPEWSGSLQARILSMSDAGPDAADTKPAWDAGTRLPSPDLRNIFTGTGDDGDPDTPSSIKLSPLEVSNLPDGTDPALVAWIRGDRDQEQTAGGEYPDRDQLIGAIVHGNPVLVDAVPAAGYADPDYRAFSAMVASSGRPEMLYVIANDGMLHGFNSGVDGGRELFAYLPRLLHPRLRDLAAEEGRQRLIFDGQITVQDARVSDDPTGSRWRTIAVATAGRGQRGLFALDITSPADYQVRGGFNPEHLLWEIDPERHGSHFAALGYLINPVSIIRVAVEDGGQEWLVVTGNGIADTQTPEQEAPSLPSTIYTIDPATGEPRQSIELSRNGGGMTSVTAVDINSDGYTERLYGADLSGSIWRLDWNASSRQFDRWPNPSDDAAPLFTAISSPLQGGRRQAVTGGIEVAALPGRGPNSQQAHGVMLYFGTGTLLEYSDIVDEANPQSLYGIWDNGVDAVRRDQLVERNLKESLAGATTVRTITSPTPQSDRTATPRGWVIDLPVSGERSINAPVLLFDRVQFTTYASPLAHSDPCARPPRRFVVEVDAIAGNTDAGPVLDLDQDLVLGPTDRTEQGEAPAGIELEGDAASPLTIVINGPDGPLLTRITLDSDGIPRLLATPIVTQRIAWRRRMNR